MCCHVPGIARSIEGEADQIAGQPVPGGIVEDLYPVHAVAADHVALGVVIHAIAIGADDVAISPHLHAVGTKIGDVQALELVVVRDQL